MSTSPTTPTPQFKPGTLVRARHRDWVVLPPEPHDTPAQGLLRLRPLAGAEHERVAVLPALEPVRAAEFVFPDPTAQAGNYLAARHLRDATRLSTRAAAGPFLSLARIGVEPRPYQFVPLMMALQQEPVRLLIADDVGVGKTIEACLIARELWDRGDIKSMTVLCPPSLADQWVRTLTKLFHLDAALVLPSTAARLERQAGDALFRQYPVTVVSLDYIKSDRRRDVFLRDCPDMVIVDEAHTCADTPRGAAQKRYKLLEQLVQGPKGASRNLILVTATPHTGNQDAFRSLLKLLDPTLAELPSALIEPDHGQARTEPEQEKLRVDQWRNRLATHFIQRRRADLERHLKDDPHQRSPFPDRLSAQVSADLHAQQRAYLIDMLKLCYLATHPGQEQKAVEGKELHLRYWSALALLRAVSSSPAAAEATLLARAGLENFEQLEELDQAALIALDDREDEDTQDGVLGISGALGVPQQELLTLAKRARALRGPKADLKLAATITEAEALLKAGHNPIIFCRFIPTAHYVAEHMEEQLAKKVKGLQVVTVTGELPHDARDQYIQNIEPELPRVLVCTDCLSEGLDLQHRFNAVIHYDLSWTPTRHEQREGRVDRYEQPADEVFLMTLYVEENPVDRYVLTVINDKREIISTTIGTQVGEDTSFAAIQRSLLALFDQTQSLRDVPSALKQQTGALFSYKGGLKAKDWKRSQAPRSKELFAQIALQSNVEERLPELLKASQDALGTPQDAVAFLKRALPELGAIITQESERVVSFNLSEASPIMRELLLPPGWKDTFSVSAFAPGRDERFERIVRTHPLVAQTAAYLMEAALDPDHDPALPNPAKRCSVVRTKGVERLTNLLIIRARYSISFASSASDARQETIVDDIVPIAFGGGLHHERELQIIDGSRAEQLLNLEPSQNLDEAVIQEHLKRFSALENRAHLDQAVMRWIKEVRVPHLQEQYKRIFEIRVRTVEGHRQLARQMRLEPMERFDHLAITVYLPD